jgi:hypothetical protein
LSQSLAPFPRTTDKSTLDSFYEQESLEHNLYVNLCLGDSQCSSRNKDWADLGIVFGTRDSRHPYVVFSRLIELLGDYKTARTTYIMSQWANSEFDFLVVDPTEPSLMDYRVNYSVYLEFAKLSLIKSFSVFDKIATFLNEYEQLGIPDRQVRYWRHPKSRAKTVFEFENSRLLSENPRSQPLTALHSVSIELRDERVRVAGVRNALVHHYLVVHVFGPLESYSYPLGDPGDRIVPDPSGEHSAENPVYYHVLLDDFRGMVLDALKLARAAVLYTIQFVASKERPRSLDPGVMPGPPVGGVFG